MQGTALGVGGTPMYGNFYVQSFLGLGQAAEVDIELLSAEKRKKVEVLTEDGKKERLSLYYDGESVSGKVPLGTSLWSVRYDGCLPPGTCWAERKEAGAPGHQDRVHRSDRTLLRSREQP